MASHWLSQATSFPRQPRHSPCTPREHGGAPNLRRARTEKLLMAEGAGRVRAGGGGAGDVTGQEGLSCKGLT